MRLFSIFLGLSILWGGGSGSYAQNTFEYVYPTAAPAAFTGAITNAAHNYVLTGQVGNALVLAEVNILGTPIWARTYAPQTGYTSARGMSVVQTSDGGYAVAATITSPATNEDIWLLKTNAQGQPLWNLKMGNAFRNDVVSNYTVIQLANGDLALAALSAKGSNIADYEAYVARVSAQGQLLWGRHFSHTGAQPDWF
jgi:hypothetical protein